MQVQRESAQNLMRSRDGGITIVPLEGDEGEARLRRATLCPRGPEVPQSMASACGAR